MTLIEAVPKVEELVASGWKVSKACHAVAEEIGVKPNSLAVTYYATKRNGEPKPKTARTRTRKAPAPAPVVEAPPNTPIDLIKQARTLLQKAIKMLEEFHAPFLSV